MTSHVISIQDLHKNTDRIEDLESYITVLQKASFIQVYGQLVDI